MTIGERLREIRRGRNQTQAEVAADLGVSQPMISMLERGKVTPRSSKLRRLAAYYRVLLADLLPPRSAS